MNEDNVIPLFSHPIRTFCTNKTVRGMESLIHERSRLARRCCADFDLYHQQGDGTDIQRDVGKLLLIDAMLFLQIENLIAKRPEDAGLADHPFLSTLRKVLTTEGLFAIPPLPMRVYHSLH